MVRPYLRNVTDTFFKLHTFYIINSNTLKVEYEPVKNPNFGLLY